MATIRWLISVIALVIYIKTVHPYNTNRQNVCTKRETATDGDNCDYYDNPIFGLAPVELNERINFLQNRMQIAEPEEKPIETRMNRDRGKLYAYNNQAAAILEAAKYNNQDTRRSSPRFFIPGMTVTNSMELLDSEEELKRDYDSTNLWRVDEIPLPIGFQTLPDVYFAGDGNESQQMKEDAPPISDIMSIEQSELTEETHDLEEVEIEEKYLNNPESEMKEVIVENVTLRPETSSITENIAVAFINNKMFDKDNKNHIKKAKEEPKKVVNVKDEDKVRTDVASLSTLSATEAGKEVQVDLGEKKETQDDKASGADGSGSKNTEGVAASRGTITEGVEEAGGNKTEGMDKNKEKSLLL